LEGEEGIGVWSVTGVQTCALPILGQALHGRRDGQPLTFTAAVESLAYLLDQAFGFYSAGDLYENVGGRGEKWFLGSGGLWYFIRSGEGRVGEEGGSRGEGRQLRIQ